MKELLRFSNVEGYNGLLEDLQRSAKQLYNPYKQSFSVDFLELLEENKQIADRTEETFAHREEVDEAMERSPVTASYAGHLALYAVHSRLINQDGYPFNHADTGTWKEDIEASVLDNGEDLETGNFGFDVAVRDAMSNIPSRYFPVKLIATKLASRTKSPLRALDMGAGRLHGGKMLAGQLEFSIPKLDGIDALGLDKFGRSSLEFAQVVGIDQWGIENDPATDSWSRACSLPPHEAVDARRVQQYDYLDRLKLSNAELRLGIIGTQQFFEYHPDLRQSMNIVTMSTIIYQMNQAKIKYSLAQAKDCLTEDGIIIVQDHVVLDRLGRMKPINNWQDQKSYPYRTYVYDSKFPESGWVEVFRWTTGRCNEGKIPDRQALETLTRLAH